MQEIYKDYLFEKHILVSEGNFEEENIFETLFALAHFFGVRIIKGEKLVNHRMIGELSKRFGENVPGPFYKGFPKSVRALTTEQAFGGTDHFRICPYRRRREERIFMEDNGRTAIWRDYFFRG